MSILHSSRARALCAVVALALGSADSAAQGVTVDLWEFSGSVHFAGLDHSGNYRPLSMDTEYGIAFRVTARPPRWPLALRAEFGSCGGGAEVRDSVAITRYAPESSLELSHLSLDNAVRWFALGVELGPRYERWGAYASASVGTLAVTGGGLAFYSDGSGSFRVQDYLTRDPVFAAFAGVGAQVWIDKARHHGTTIEVGMLTSSVTDYIGTPESATNFAGTHLYTARGGVTGWMVRVGYSFRRSWGRGAVVGARPPVAPGSPRRS